MFDAIKSLKNDPISSVVEIGCSYFNIRGFQKVKKIF